MIVDVLRNDLGRVCRPGSVRVPRLCRLERTAAVQHLVSTVTGVLAPGRDAFDLLAASFPGGSITGAPKIRRDGDPRGSRAGPPRPVHRRASAGSGRTARCRRASSIRTFVADGRRLTLHVGGGITWKSDPAAEWDETVTKARGPLGAIGAVEVGMSGPGTPRSGEAGHVWVDGRLLPADGSHLSVFDRGFQLGDGVFETLRVRGAHPTELAEHVARLRRSAAGLDIPLPADIERPAGRRHRRRCSPPRGSTVRPATPRSGSRSRAVRSAARGLLPPDEVVEADHRHPGVAGPAAARPSISRRGLHLVASAVRRDPANPLVTLKTTSRADYVYARLEARRAGADDALFLTVDGHLSEGDDGQHLPRPALAGGRGGRARDAVARLRDPARDDPVVAAGWGARVGLRPVEGASIDGDLADADEAFLSLQRRRGAAGDPLRGRRDRRGPAGAVDAARARAIARR